MGGAMTGHEAIRRYQAGESLAGATLRHADLSGAVLRHATLRHADLSDADLSYADLRHAALSAADLSGAALGYAAFSGADLSGTCLDPLALPSGAGQAFARLRCRDGTQWCVGYRTRHSPCCDAGHDGYRDGQWYEAPVFSISSTECHPGLYVCERPEDCPGGARIKVLFRGWEAHRVGHKWRVRSLLAWGAI